MPEAQGSNGEAKSPRPRGRFRPVRLLLILAGLPVAFGFWTMMPLAAWFPHERIVISLPFAPEDDPNNLIPMGETIEHANAPHGHPGIDFQWDHSVPIIAAATGTVQSISFDKSHGSWDVVVRTGVYEVRYKELEEYEKRLKKGELVQKGDLIGIPCHPTNLPDGNLKHYQLHWELASAVLWKDRFCPLGYFDTDSARIEAIWDRTNSRFKDQFPNICSGDYYGKED